MTADETHGIVTALGNILAILRDADPADKAKIYADVGLRLTYEPGRNKVIAEAAPAAIMYKGSCPRPELNPQYIGHPPPRTAALMLVHLDLNPRPPLPKVMASRLSSVLNNGR